MNIRPITSLLRAAVLSASVLAIAGCASTPTSNEPMAVAEAVVQRANTTSTSADAASELRIANEKLASARVAVGKKDYERATQLAEQAQVDAQVAMLHAESERSRKAAQESQDAARVLADEITRKTVR